MDKQSKILLIMVVILTTISVSYTFYKTIIKNSFEIISDNVSSSSDTNTDITQQ